MLDLRQRLFLIISIVILLILAMILGTIAIRKHQQVTSTEQTPTVTTPVTDNTVAPEIFDTSLNLNPTVGDPNQLSSVLANEDQTARFVRQRAIDFVERFLSYSNQTRNSNIRDVLPLVTSEMAGWIKTQTQAYSDTYKGSTTQVIVSRVDSMTEDTAIVHIEAQQYLESTTENERVYHKGRVELVQKNKEWLIDGLYWE